MTTANELMLPWLNSIVGARNYVYGHVADPNTNLENLQLAVALLLSGATDRAWWICETLKDPGHYDSPLEDFEKLQMQYATELQRQIDTRQYSALLEDWMNTNLMSLGLDK